MLPTASLIRFTNWERIIVRSWRNAGLCIFTNNVWFFMNFSPVYRATPAPTTLSQASTARRCSRGVSRPSRRRYIFSKSLIDFTSRLNIHFIY